MHRCAVSLQPRLRTFTRTLPLDFPSESLFFRAIKINALPVYFLFYFCFFLLTLCCVFLFPLALSSCLLGKLMNAMDFCSIFPLRFAFAVIFCCAFVLFYSSCLYLCFRRFFFSCFTKLAMPMQSRLDSNMASSTIFTALENFLFCRLVHFQFGLDCIAT